MSDPKMGEKMGVRQIKKAVYFFCLGVILLMRRKVKWWLHVLN
jgi:hypothetical protein